MSELKIISQHAGTVLVGQLAVMAFGVADTVIAGRYSDEALAALSVGSAIYISVYVGLIGIVQALLPIWAEMRGARQYEAVGQSLRQSLYLCSFITAAGMAALLFPGPLLRWAQVPELMQDDVRHYLAILAFGFPPSLLFRIYSTFNQSLGKPLLVTWLQIGSLALKIPLSVWLVAGGGGVAPMGVAGCAWATLIVNYLLLVLALVMLRSQALYRPFFLWRRMERPDWPQIRGFARLGIPGGLAYLVEVTSFTLMALFIARLGTTASASHQIAASVAAVLYMMPLVHGHCLQCARIVLAGCGTAGLCQAGGRAGPETHGAGGLGTGCDYFNGRQAAGKLVFRQPGDHFPGVVPAGVGGFLPRRRCHPGTVRLFAALLPYHAHATGAVWSFPVGAGPVWRLPAGLRRYRGPCRHPIGQQLLGCQHHRDRTGRRRPPGLAVAHGLAEPAGHSGENSGSVSRADACRGENE